MGVFCCCVIYFSSVELFRANYRSISILFTFANLFLLAQHRKLLGISLIKCNSAIISSLRHGIYNVLDRFNGAQKRNENLIIPIYSWRRETDWSLFSERLCVKLIQVFIFCVYFVKKHLSSMRAGDASRNRQWRQIFTQFVNVSFHVNGSTWWKESKRRKCRFFKPVRTLELERRTGVETLVETTGAILHLSLENSLTHSPMHSRPHRAHQIFQLHILCTRKMQCFSSPFFLALDPTWGSFKPFFC